MSQKIMNIGRPRRVWPGRRRLGALLLGTIIVVGVAACSSDNAEETRPASTVKPTSTIADKSPAQSGDEVIEVAAVDYGFKNLPGEVKAGTQLRLTNEAPGELYELVAFRLPDEEKRPVTDLVKLPPAEIGQLMGTLQPTTVLLTPPNGEQIAAVGDGTLADPGRYMIICSIPTGADPDAYLAAAAASNGGPPQVAGGPPHLVHGMFAEVLVS